jgi:hypothetical protein
VKIKAAIKIIKNIDVPKEKDSNPPGNEPRITAIASSEITIVIQTAISNIIASIAEQTMEKTRQVLRS